MEYLYQQLREKHHHCKLQLVTTTANTKCEDQGARCKGKGRVRVYTEGNWNVCPYASCNDCCIVHSASTGADPELVSGGSGWNSEVASCSDLCWCWSSPLHLAPWPLQLCLRGCHRLQLTMVEFLPQLLAQILHLHTWWLHPLQLAPMVFFLPPTGADTVLTLEQLALCGGGGTRMLMWRWWL